MFLCTYSHKLYFIVAVSICTWKGGWQVGMIKSNLRPLKGPVSCVLWLQLLFKNHNNPKTQLLQPRVFLLYCSTNMF